jgi:hypothetical protein
VLLLVDDYSLYYWWMIIDAPFRLLFKSHYSLSGPLTK